VLSVEKINPTPHEHEKYSYHNIEKNVGEKFELLNHMPVDPNLEVPREVIPKH